MDENKILLEILLQPIMTRPSGMRVYMDGLYQSYRGSSDWKDVWTFTDEEMDTLRKAIDKADIPSLASHYEAQQRVEDGTTTIWHITTEGETYQIHCAPGAKVPALDKLYHTFSTLRKLSPEHSHWKVWQPGGSYRKFTVIGSVNAIDALRPLVSAMFVPSDTNSTGERAVDPETLLVKTLWVSEEKTEQTSLYADGKYIRKKGEEVTTRELSAQQVLNVMDAIQGINWSEIPDEIDTTA